VIESVGVAGTVDTRVGDEVALPGDRVGVGGFVRLATTVGVGTDVVATSGGVAVSDAPGAGGVPVAGVSNGVASRPGEEEGSATGVPEGSGSEIGAGVAPLCALAGMASAPSAKDRSGRFEEKTSPATARAPSGPNKGTFMVSS